MQPGFGRFDSTTRDGRKSRHYITEISAQTAESR